MKATTVSLTIFLLLFLLVAAPSVFSEVEILMKNGAEIRAGGCERDDGRFKCFKDDGTFYLEENDVVRISNAEGVRKDVPMAESPLLEERKSDPPQDGKTGPERRLEQIRQRKSELMSGRERLVGERLKLQEDIKNAADWMPVKQFEELKRRNAVLDEKIGTFNEEVTSLAEEEKRLAESMKGQEK
jgi:hypothetical protein